jgi:hypothetical protein
MLLLQQMNKMKIKKRFIYLCIFFLGMLPISSIAQITPDCNPDEPCPIDSNVYFLLAAAIFVAAKKTYDYKKKQIVV